MGWLRSLFSPMRRLWCRLNAVQQRKSTYTQSAKLNLFTSESCEMPCLKMRESVGAERGIYILYDDVKSCQCEDVHVLWSILVESYGLPPPTPPVLRLTKR